MDNTIINTSEEFLQFIKDNTDEPFYKLGLPTISTLEDKNSYDMLTEEICLLLVENFNECCLKTLFRIFGNNIAITEKVILVALPKVSSYYIKGVIVYLRDNNLLSYNIVSKSIEYYPFAITLCDEVFQTLELITKAYEINFRNSFGNYYCEQYVNSQTLKFIGSLYNQEEFIKYLNIDIGPQIILLNKLSNHRHNTIGGKYNIRDYNKEHQEYNIKEILIDAPFKQYSNRCPVYKITITPTLECLGILTFDAKSKRELIDNLIPLIEKYYSTIDDYIRNNNLPKRREVRVKNIYRVSREVYNTN
jgi:hypothetical protein